MKRTRSSTPVNAKSSSGASSSSSESIEERRKRLLLMLGRVERVVVEKGLLVPASRDPSLDTVAQNVHKDEYNVTKSFGSSSGEPLSLTYSGVDWDRVRQDISLALFDGSPLPQLVLEEVAYEESREQMGLRESLVATKKRSIEERNGLAIIQGRWRKEAYASRSYNALSDYIIADTVCAKDAEEIREQLQTPLAPGFYGPALNCDDQVHTEEWMRRFNAISPSGGSVKASLDDVVSWQVQNCMDYLVGTVQDRVCNESGVVTRDPVGLGARLKECPVWGMDSNTRRNIELVLLDSLSNGLESAELLGSIQNFIERSLLPAINAQDATEAHNMTSSLRFITQHPMYSSEHKDYANKVLTAIELFGIDMFRIHPKGTGVVCTDPAGIAPHVVISEYLGELYPPYRWCEKLGVLEKTQKIFGLKPALPDFYNILLERPRLDEKGYGLLFVDASRHANMGSSCSHSCNANCTSSVVVRRGKTVIVLTTNRFVHYGEELCMDYYSVTSSELEWRAAICLCGMRNCRGSFLHYSTQNDLQQVLNRYCSPLYRFASLATACSGIPLDEDAHEVFKRHGILRCALGADAPNWIRRYAYENLKFIEYERRSLPSALLRSSVESSSPLPNYSFEHADGEARCVMESRLQAVVMSFSVVRHLLANQPEELQSAQPVLRLQTQEAIKKVWDLMRDIPKLLMKHLSPSSSKTGTKAHKISLPALEGSAELSTDTPLETGSSAQKTDETDDVLGTAVMKINGLLELVPASYGAMSKILLDVRLALQPCIKIASLTARIPQLMDILVLWAHTSNFIVPQIFAPVKSEPVSVFARELGNNVPRDKVLAHQTPPVKEQPNAPPVLFKASSALEDSRERADAPSRSPAAFPAHSSPNSSPGSVEIREAFDKFSESDGPLGSSAISFEEVLHEPSSALPPRARELRSGGKSPALPQFVDANEVVRVDTFDYDPMFIFWQLMGWFNSGTDEPITPPDVFGSLQLPLPSQCFGPAEIAYSSSARDSLMSHILNEFKQSGPWPATVKKTFSPLPHNSSTTLLLGSPFLDVLLGQGQVVIKNMVPILYPNAGSRRATFASTKDIQYDTMLPPETSHCTWVMCHKCLKWRRVAWHVDPASLDSFWECCMNHWDIDKASCDVAEDVYDSQTEECGDTDGTNKDLDVFHALDTLPTTTLAECPEGCMRDVFCVRNKVWYKARILRHIPAQSPDGVDKVRIHFNGWPEKFDEDVEVDSGRIQPVGLFSSRKKTKAAETTKPPVVDTKSTPKKKPASKATPAKKRSSPSASRSPAEGGGKKAKIH